MSIHKEKLLYTEMSYKLLNKYKYKSSSCWMVSSLLYSYQILNIPGLSAEAREGSLLGADLRPSCISLVDSLS